MEQIPPDFEKKRIVIFCNDCEKRSDIKFSFEYRKLKPTIYINIFGVTRNKKNLDYYLYDAK